MATAYSGPNNFSYNPFSATQVLRDGMGNVLYQKGPDGTWYEAVARPSAGDMDFSPTQYDWKPIQGEPPKTYYNKGGTVNGDEGERDLTPGWQLDYNQDALRKNNPELAASWLNYDTGNFMRDGMGYVNAKLVNYDPQTGIYTLLEKTGDKDGTYRFFKDDGNGGVTYLGDGETVNWDTNKNVTEQGAFQIAKVALAPVAAWGMSQVAQAAFNALPAATQAAITEGWSALTAPIKEAFGSIDAYMQSAFPEAFQGASAGSGAAGSSFSGAPGPENVFEYSPPGTDPFSNAAPPGSVTEAITGSNPYDLTPDDLAGATNPEQPLRNISQPDWVSSEPPGTFDTNYAGTSPNQTWNNLAEGKPSGVEYSDSRVNEPSPNNNETQNNETERQPNHDDTSDMKLSDTDVSGGGSTGSVLKQAWDLFNTPLGTALLGGVIKIGAGLYADKQAEKRYNEQIEMINRNQNVNNLNIPQVGGSVGGLMSTMVSVPPFNAFATGPK